jgi:hypothetical protein
MERSLNNGLVTKRPAILCVAQMSAKYLIRKLDWSNNRMEFFGARRGQCRYCERQNKALPRGLTDQAGRALR